MKIFTTFAGMQFVLYSVICSVIVSVLLKLARKKRLDTFQIICWNYPTAVLLTYFFFEPSVEHILNPNHAWEIFVPLAFLLPSVFFALSLSLKSVGIVRTEVAQRLSLIVPLIAAFYWFGEQLQWTTAIGLSIGFIAILLCIGWSKTDPRQYKRQRNPWFYPTLVFLGYGLCDILFKRIAQTTSIPYTTAMFVVFVMAMLFAFLWWYIMALRNSSRFQIPAIFWGSALGLFNFANILFYMKAHRALPDNPSIVFAGMNMGVIALGALVGLWLFKEKLSKWNWVGIGLAMMAVAILAYTK